MLSTVVVDGTFYRGKVKASGQMWVKVGAGGIPCLLVNIGTI